MKPNSNIVAISGVEGGQEIVCNAGTYRISSVWSVLATASAAICVVHGYRRTGSVGWALGWGLFGTLMPVIAPVLAIAEGFGEPEKR